MLTIDRKTKDAKLESKMFNLLHQVGIPVHYSNGDRENEWIESVTKSNAFAVGETAYILLSGVGRIPLSRIKVR